MWMKRKHQEVYPGMTWGDLAFNCGNRHVLANLAASRIWAADASFFDAVWSSNGGCRTNKTLQGTKSDHFINFCRFDTAMFGDHGYSMLFWWRNYIEGTLLAKPAMFDVPSGKAKKTGKLRSYRNFSFFGVEWVTIPETNTPKNFLQKTRLCSSFWSLSLKVRTYFECAAGIQGSIIAVNFFWNCDLSWISDCDAWDELSGEGDWFVWFDMLMRFATESPKAFITAVNLHNPEPWKCSSNSDRAFLRLTQTNFITSWMRPSKIKITDQTC